MARHRRASRLTRVLRADSGRSATVARLTPIAGHAWLHCPDGTTIPVHWLRRRLGRYEVRVPPATPEPQHGSLIQIRQVYLGVIYPGGIAS